MQEAVVLDKVSLAAEDLDLSAWYELPLTWHEYANTCFDQRLERIGDAAIVLTNKIALDSDLLTQLPHLKLVVLLATGTNNIDLKAAKAHGIQVCHMVDYSTESVAQHVLAVMFAMASQLFHYRAAVTSGHWSESDFFGLLDFPITELSSQCLGLIGYGAIAKRVEQMAQGLGMQVLIAESVNPQASKTSSNGRLRLPLAQVLAAADYLSIHCPLNEHTNNLIAAPQLAQMKPSAAIINTARGGIVNEADLARALCNKSLAAAAVDVLSTEPPKPGHILLDEQIPNLILTPHSAWGSRRSRQQLVAQTHAILAQFCQLGEVQIQRVV